MLEHQPRAPVVLSREAVDKILVDRGENEAARRKQFAEIAVAGIRKIFGVMIPMYHQHQREWPCTLGIPHARIKRHGLHVEAPEIFAITSGRGGNGDVRRHVHGLRLVRHGVLELLPLFIRPRSIKHSHDLKRPRLGRVLSGYRLESEYSSRVVFRELERLRAGGKREADGEADGEARRDRTPESIHRH